MEVHNSLEGLCVENMVCIKVYALPGGNMVEENQVGAIQGSTELSLIDTQLNETTTPYIVVNSLSPLRKAVQQGPPSCARLVFRQKDLCVMSQF